MSQASSLFIIIYTQKEALKSNHNTLRSQGFCSAFSNGLRTSVLSSCCPLLSWFPRRRTSWPTFAASSYRTCSRNLSLSYEELDSEPMTFCTLSTSNLVLCLYRGVLGICSSVSFCYHPSGCCIRFSPVSYSPSECFKSDIFEDPASAKHRLMICTRLLWCLSACSCYGAFYLSCPADCTSSSALSLQFRPLYISI